MMGDTICVGTVGPGLAARVLAVCDNDGQRAEAFAERYGAWTGQRRKRDFRNVNDFAT